MRIDEILWQFEALDGKEHIKCGMNSSKDSTGVIVSIHSVEHRMEPVLEDDYSSQVRLWRVKKRQIRP